MLTLEKSKKLLEPVVTQPHLIAHAVGVMAAMGGMAAHFNENVDNWQAIGYLHDYDYETNPDEHLQHTEQPLLNAGLSNEEVRAILSHGWTLCSDVEPLTTCEKSLFTVDELTGIISACAKMRPNGINDLEVSSFMKKFKDLKFAAKCNRDIIKKGCEMLNMDVKQVSEICINAMKPYASELGLNGKGV